MPSIKTIQKERKTNALSVALYFIKKGLDNDRAITNKQLQKLVYYAQAWSLVLNKEKLFNERIEAWVHGPAIPDLYEKFKRFGAEPIILEPEELQFNFPKKQKEVLENVWRVYGKLDANYLEVLVHSEIPWQEARKELQGFESSNNEILLKTMKSYYSEKLEKAQKDK